MFESFGRTWQLVKVSFGVVRKDKEILLFPIIAGTILILVTISYFTGLFFSGLISNVPVLIVSIFLIYFFSYFIMIYSNVAIVGCAMMRLNGGDPTLGDGFRIANQNLKAIFGWAVVSGIVGLIINAIKDIRVGNVPIGRFIGNIFGFAWNMITFFIIPVLIYEKQGIFSSMKRSGRLFRNSWGETFIGHFALGFIFFLLGLGGIVFLIIGALIGGLYGLIIGLIAAIIYWVVIAAMGVAVKGIFVAALYRYATTGELAPEYEGYGIPAPSR